jgi:hypothetical protein
VKIVVDINHPGHVHFFKNFIWEMEKRGHEIMIIARDKDVTVKLLDAYGFHYTLIKENPTSLISKILSIPLLDFKIYNLVKSFDPDLFMGIASWKAAHVAFLLRKKSIIFDDTEHAIEQILLYRFFASVICTPSCFQKDYGEKQIRYKGYHELAYLHPSNFTPDSTALTKFHLTEGESFIIVRFVSWKASHDIGQYGICDKIGLVKTLEKYGRVLITSENALPSELQSYQILVSPEKLHDLLYYATLYVGEGATTASESAILGTHAIYVNTLRLGYTDEEEEKYGLVYTFSDPLKMEKDVFEKAVELLNDPHIRANGKKKREILLDDKIDVTGFMINLAEKTAQK